ncbi:hypothetical protein CHS0354_024765, partial [Potamilus streckersoni]
MTLFAITLLLGLTVLVTGYPMPPGYGQDTFTHGVVGHSLDGFSNLGNLDFDNRGRLWDSQNIGGSFVVDRSFDNMNGRGISSTNRANIYDGTNIYRYQLRGQGWDGSRDFGNWDNGHSARQGNILNSVGSSVIDRSVGNINGRGISSTNRANIYDGTNIYRDQLGGQGWDGSRYFGTLDIGHSARQGNIRTSVGSSIAGRSISKMNGRGTTGVNRADIYDRSGSVGNGNQGRISGDIFRRYGRDGTELDIDQTRAEVVHIKDCIPEPEQESEAR